MKRTEFDVLFRHRWNPAVKIFIILFPMGGLHTVINEGPALCSREGVMVTQNGLKILDAANLKSEVGRGPAAKSAADCHPVSATGTARRSRLLPPAPGL